MRPRMQCTWPTTTLPSPNHPLASAIGARIPQKPRNGGFWPCCGRAMAFFFGLLDMDRLVSTICIDPCPMDGSPMPPSALGSPNQVHVCAQFHCFSKKPWQTNDLSLLFYISWKYMQIAIFRSKNQVSTRPGCWEPVHESVTLITLFHALFAWSSSLNVLQALRNRDWTLYNHDVED